MDIKLIHNITEEDTLSVRNRLRAFNLANLGEFDREQFGVFLEDENGSRQGGITGEIFGNWLEIDFFYIEATYRGLGLGTKLITAVEDEARSRGCKYAFVDTFSFQAPEFYKKHGYTEVFTLNDYPVSGKRYYYTKEL